METADMTRSIDARGMPCPGPLMSLIGAIRDEGSKSDIPAWVAKAGHELVGVTEDAGYAHFVIRKAR